MTSTPATGDAAGPLPNFLLIGAQKAGSSTLHDYMSRHDEIFMPSRKELHYFDDARFTRTMADYRQAFLPGRAAARIGEGTPSYLSYPGCAEKIHGLLGDIPLVVILRDPVSRMYSQYWHGVKYGRETLSFLDALKAEDARREELGMSFYRFFDYLSRSAYETHIRKYRAQFSRLHVCRLEDLSRDPLGTLNGIYDFLGVKTVSEVAELPASNSSRLARVQSVNQALNAYEDRFGANRVTGLIRRKNFYPYKYPKLSDSDRQFAIDRLHEICPDTVTTYGLR
ncbi:MAG: sulfotransferase [Rhodobacteraceae bacterium]|nr:sulfotransferase [Paracoccaceae bacterium]